MHDGSDGLTEEIVISKSKKAIDKAQEINGFVVLYCHSYNQYSGTTYTTRKNSLEAILNYIKQKIDDGLMISGTTADVCKYYFG